MFRNPAKTNCKTVISNISKDCIQPNFIDLKLKKVLEIKPTVFKLAADNKKTMRDTVEVIPDADGFFHLEGGKMYEIITDHEVEKMEHVGWLHQRSSLGRCGLKIYSGIFDQGFSGVIGGILEVKGGPAELQIGARVAQFVMADAESLYDYDGSYGRGKETEKKYTS